jgi:hypothetical protein
VHAGVNASPGWLHPACAAPHGGQRSAVPWLRGHRQPVITCSGQEVR